MSHMKEFSLINADKMVQHSQSPEKNRKIKIKRSIEKPKEPMDFAMLPMINDKDFESLEINREITLRNAKSKFTLLGEAIDLRNE